MPSAIDNPFYTVTIGSTVREDDGTISAPVLNEGLTTFLPSVSGKVSMSGSSAFMYSDSMNQGSMGVSGAYGVSGVSRVTSAVSAYVGNTTASDSRTTSLSINLVTWAGVEYVDFNELSVTDLAHGLKANARQYLETALVTFNAMRDADDADRSDAIKAWVAACERFYDHCGTGVVVGVLWGAFGAVNLEFSESGSESKWRYGGDANFSYAGTTGSVAVSAAYGGSRSSIAKSGSASVTGFYNGGSVRNEINAWVEHYSKIAEGGLTKLGAEGVTRNAAFIDNTATPKIPDPVEPKKTPKLTKLIGEIKNLDGLETYAAAAAFDKYRQNGGEGDLDTFLKERAAPNDLSGLPDDVIAPQIEPEPDNTGGNMTLQARVRQPRMKAALGGGGATEDAQPHTGASVQTDFEPMGIWVSSWARLFPWLVTGRDNRVLEGAAANDMIRLRTFIQDCLSLVRIYDRVASAGATIKGVDFQALSDGFQRSADDARDLIPNATKPGLEERLNKVLDQMSTPTRAIYRIWARHDFLRRYELGGGLFVSLDESLTEHGTLQGINETRNDAAMKDDFDGVLLYQKSGFEPKNPTPNTVAFRRFIKAAPVILPDGHIAVFLTNGDLQTSGFLTKRLHRFEGKKFLDKFEFHKVDVLMRHTGQAALSDTKVMGRPLAAAQSPVLFSPENGRLVAVGTTSVEAWDNVDFGQHCLYTLVPIPFSAARGISDWKYFASATGTGNLQMQLATLHEELRNMPAWSLDSDLWDGIQWSDNIYSTRMIKPSYVGLSEDPRNVFTS